MNKERAKQLLPIIQAAADGKVIQVLTYGQEWRDVVDTSLLDGYVYRIKPEPREIYVNEYPSGWSPCHNSLASAMSGATRNVVRVGVKYREVIEE